MADWSFDDIEDALEDALNEGIESGPQSDGLMLDCDAPDMDDLLEGVDTDDLDPDDVRDLLRGGALILVIYPSYVVYRTLNGDYQRDYTMNDDGTVTLGDPSEVKQSISYDPVAAAEPEQQDAAQTDNGTTYLRRIYQLLKNKVSPEEWDKAVKSARGHAGGKAKARAAQRVAASAHGFKDYSADERKALAAKGHALPDGSYPIATKDDLKNAVQAFGRKGTPRVKAHIIKRAAALNSMGLLPVDWQAAKPTGMNEDGGGWQLFAELPSGVPDWIHCLPRPGVYKHPRFGDVAVTRERNQAFIDSFRQRIYQEHIPIDAEHETKLSGACGWYRDFRMNEDGSVDAQIEWTDRGRTLLESKRFRYFSPEWWDVWPDPATGVRHANVLTGGALTTRPYFKDANLRPLIASDTGLFAASEVSLRDGDDSVIVGGVVLEAFSYEPDGDGHGKGKEQHVEDVKGAVTLTEEEYRTFTELKTSFAAAEEARKAAEERVARLEGTARTKRFTEMVLGQGGQGDGARWYGGLEAHVKMLESLSQQFGEDSDEFKHYVELNGTHAKQMREGKLFASAGSERSGDGTGAWEQIEAKARSLMTDQPQLYRELNAAIERVIDMDPALAQKAEQERSKGF